MPAQLIPIAKLNPDQIPVTLKAVIRSVRPTPQSLVSREGLLKDETGEIPFNVWKDSGLRGLKAGRHYLFHRAGLGLRNGRLEVRVQKNTRVFLLKNEAGLKRILKKISRLEEAERKKLLRSAKDARRFPGGTKRNFYSILITIGIFLWGLIMVLRFTGILSEKKLIGFFRSWKGSAAREIAVPAREGKVEAVVSGGEIIVRVGEKELAVHYLGLEVPPPPKEGEATINPWALRALNFNRYLVGGKTVRLEFEGSRPPGEKEAWSYVFLDGKLINAALLERGLARRVSAPGKLKYFSLLEKAESSARASHLGIWGGEKK